MPTGSQRCPRLKMVLPLRVWPANETEPMQWAHTVEISHIGCRLGGLHKGLSPGQTVTLQRGQHKAAFRVVWSRQLGANENQAGIEALDYHREIWGVDLPPATLPTSSLASSEDTDATDEVTDNATHYDPVDVDSFTADSASAGSSRNASSIASRAKKSKSSLSPARNAAHKSFPAAIRSRRVRGLVFGLLILSFLAAGRSLYQQTFVSSGLLAIQPPVPTPPTASDLARLTPRPIHMPASLVERLAPSASRLQVTEAPTAHVVYPEAPSESITGKVHLQIVVAANGLVKKIHVLSGDQLLARAAAQAVRVWHYKSLDGSDKSTERETSVTVSFVGGDAVVLEFPSAKSQIRAN